MGNKLARNKDKDAEGKSREAGVAPAASSVPNGADETGEDLDLPSEFTHKNDRAIGIEDFELLKVLGKGSFGKVMLVRYRGDQQLYAMKTLRKAALVKRNQLGHTATERTILQTIRNPFLVKLNFAFQSQDKLYMVLDYMAGGELFFWLKRDRKFREPRARLYAAEITLALEALHSYDIIYRDLKPENILLDSEGHIRITDFGLSKDGVSGPGAEGGTHTFCGTPEYLAPEILQQKGHGKAVDWWSLGTLLYEMLCGLPPFYDTNIQRMYNKILQAPLRLPAHLSEPAKDILNGLLQRKVEDRIGSGLTDAEELKATSFFAVLDFDRVYNKEYQPEFVPPAMRSDTDVDNFDTEFTQERAVDSVVTTSMSVANQANFEGFTYRGDALASNSKISKYFHRNVFMNKQRVCCSALFSANQASAPATQLTAQQAKWLVRLFYQYISFSNTHVACLLDDQAVLTYSVNQKTTQLNGKQTIAERLVLLFGGSEIQVEQTTVDIEPDDGRYLTVMATGIMGQRLFAQSFRLQRLQRLGASAATTRRSMMQHQLAIRHSILRVGIGGNQVMLRTLSPPRMQQSERPEAVAESMSTPRTIISSARSLLSDDGSTVRSAMMQRADHGFEDGDAFIHVEDDDDHSDYGETTGQTSVSFYQAPVPKHGYRRSRTSSHSTAPLPFPDVDLSAISVRSEGAATSTRRSFDGSYSSNVHRTPPSRARQNSSASSSASPSRFSAKRSQFWRLLLRLSTDPQLSLPTDTTATLQTIISKHSQAIGGPVPASSVLPVMVDVVAHLLDLIKHKKKHEDNPTLETVVMVLHLTHAACEDMSSDDRLYLLQLSGMLPQFLHMSYQVAVAIAVLFLKGAEPALPGLLIKKYKAYQQQGQLDRAADWWQVITASMEMCELGSVVDGMDIGHQLLSSVAVLQVAAAVCRADSGTLVEDKVLALALLLLEGHFQLCPHEREHRDPYLREIAAACTSLLAKGFPAPTRQDLLNVIGALVTEVR